MKLAVLLHEAAARHLCETEGPPTVAGRVQHQVLHEFCDIHTVITAIIMATRTHTHLHKLIRLASTAVHGKEGQTVVAPTRRQLWMAVAIQGIRKKDAVKVMMIVAPTTIMTIIRIRKSQGAITS